MSQEISESIYKQQEGIKEKQLDVKQDLDQVEPAVIEAQNGMKRLRLLSPFINLIHTVYFPNHFCRHDACRLLSVDCVKVMFEAVVA